MSPFILAVVPARGGSKGIPGKNIVNVLGKPLIGYTLDVLKKSKFISDAICSTDSEQIAAVVDRYGIKCSRNRPPHLATDEAKTQDVVIHEILEYEKKYSLKIDSVILLQPTSPLRLVEDIDDAIEKFLARKEEESLVSCYQEKDLHPAIMYYNEGGRIMPIMPTYYNRRRQEFPDVYVRNGAIYICTRSFLFNNNSLYSQFPLVYVMPKERSINIDEKSDLLKMEKILRERDNL